MSDDDLLTAIATHGDREHVLRELEARGAMGELSARDVAHGHGLDPETADPETMATTFIDAWDQWVEETQTEAEHDR